MRISRGKKLRAAASQIARMCPIFKASGLIRKFQTNSPPPPPPLGCEETSQWKKKNQRRTLMTVYLANGIPTTSFLRELRTFLKREKREVSILAVLADGRGEGGGPTAPRERGFLIYALHHCLQPGLINLQGNCRLLP